MKERIEEPRIEDPQAEEVFPQTPSDSSPDAPMESAEPAPPEQKKIFWLRLAYAIEFLLALLASLNLWSEVGGQSHLDMMAWYTKFSCLMASAWCAVRFTAGLVEERKAWNRRTRLWLAGLILVATAMALITYYYHLHEEMDEQDSDQTAAAMIVKPPLTLLQE